MTEKPQPLSTQIAIPSQTSVSVAPPVASHDVPHKAEPVEEEEPYTIRCICNYSDDDGSTILCETCDTWQHIACFYPNNRDEVVRDDFVHSCDLCKPRQLDRQRAILRGQQLAQNALKLEQPTAEKKPTKRPPPKTNGTANGGSKKKPKPTDLQLNGQQPGQDAAKHGSPNDQPHPAKKPKHSHKPSQSSSAQQAPKRSPSYGNGRPQAHPPSPANTPPDLPSDVEIHNYSDTFLSLLNEKDCKFVEENTFASLNIPNMLGIWLRDRDRLRSDTGQDYDDVFQKMPANLNAKKVPLEVGHKVVTPPTGGSYRWQNLTTRATIEKNVPLIELHGRVGFQKDYCADPANMWEELTTPPPFVFFHPLLPVYVDSRKEGSKARFVRRSCRPNVMLETFINELNEYHFWLVSDRVIAANEQITLPWDFRLPRKEKNRIMHLLGLSHDETNGPGEEPDMDEPEYRSIASWIHRILSEYGGCSCDLGPNCAFVRFHRRWHGRPLARATAPSKKRSRKPKANPTISPTSTGHATNSRAPSEGHGDDALDDARSASGSSHSKAPSRDHTPAARQGSFDNFTAILTEPTGRDKRKVAMAEDQFRAMEQPRAAKKKRVSDGAPTPKLKSGKLPAPARTELSNGTGQVSDAGTVLSVASSPANAASPTLAPTVPPAASRQGSVGASTEPTPKRPSYTNTGMQTDRDEGEWWSTPGKQVARSRSLAHLSRRLLSSSQKRREQEERRRSQASLSRESTTAMDVDPAEPEHQQQQQPPPVPQPQPSATQLPHERQSSSPQIPPPSSEPGTMVDSSTSPVVTSSPLFAKAVLPIVTGGVAKPKSPDLRVQLPPVPAFTNAGSTVSSATTPLSATGSVVQSPFSTNLPSPFPAPVTNGVAAHHSPMKKKLTLGEYRKSKTAASKSGAATAKISTAVPDDSKQAAAADPMAIDSPTVEKTAEGVNGTTAS